MSKIKKAKPAASEFSFESGIVVKQYKDSILVKGDVLWGPPYNSFTMAPAIIKVVDVNTIEVRGPKQLSRGDVVEYEGFEYEIQNSSEVSSGTDKYFNSPAVKL